MTDCDAKAIARELTKAQQRAILILSGQWLSRPYPEQMTWLEPALLETAAPLRTGHERVRLTALGLAVRQILLSENGQ